MDFHDNKNSENNSIIKIQALFRGCMCRKNKLPNSLLFVQKILIENNINICNTNADGRVNSCLDESEVINILLQIIPDRIKNTKKRMWYDILLYDFRYGWIPINIKTTTTLTADNTGNLAMCVYSYTNECLDFEKTYQNGNMSKILLNKINKKEYNVIDKKGLLFYCNK